MHVHLEILSGVRATEDMQSLNARVYRSLHALHAVLISLDNDYVD